MCALNTTRGTTSISQHQSSFFPHYYTWQSAAAHLRSLITPQINALTIRLSQQGITTVPNHPRVHAPAAPLTTSETEEACRAMRARGQGSTSRKPGAEGRKDSRCNASALSPSLVLYMAIISNIAKTRCGLLTSPDPVPARFGPLFVRRCVRRTCNLVMRTRDCK